jgi:hypothetical protein
VFEPAYAGEVIEEMVGAPGRLFARPTPVATGAFEAGKKMSAFRSISPNGVTTDFTARPAFPAE